MGGREARRRRDESELAQTCGVVEDVMLTRFFYQLLSSRSSATSSVSSLGLQSSFLELSSSSLPSCPPSRSIHRTFSLRTRLTSASLSSLSPPSDSDIGNYHVSRTSPSRARPSPSLLLTSASSRTSVWSRSPYEAYEDQNVPLARYELRVSLSSAALPSLSRRVWLGHLFSKLNLLPSLLPPLLILSLAGSTRRWRSS